MTDAKPLDKLAKDYERKARVQSKKQGDIPEDPTHVKGKGQQKQLKKGGAGTRFGKGKSVGRVKNELKTVDQIRRDRQISERKQLRNARPTRKGKGKGRR